ncbi:MAG: hypothetical protein GF346_03190 [Candidatus Eisenbacteria bacterium]|nr:hypothetical protein [Candidatus Latescibacterota bacterium]MBD3301426.1 hypothetical protein [Candidatus Eisenbacteria bacterium]
MGLRSAWVLGSMAIGLVLFSAVPSGDASAIRLGGKVSTALYTQEVAKPGTLDEFENRTRLYERLQFTADDLIDRRISFTGSLTAWNDLTNQSIGETRGRLYRAYFRFRNLPTLWDAVRAEARLGRQWVTAGVGSGTIDGGLLRIARPGWGALTLFGGSLGIETRSQWRLDHMAWSRRLGGELRIQPNLREGIEPRIAVSFAETRREREDESRRLGVHGSLRIRRQLRLWSEVQHDFLLEETYGTAAGAEFLSRPSQLRVWAEYNRRRPALPATSVFAFFETRAVSELRGGIGMTVLDPYWLGFDFARTDFKQQNDVDRSKSFRFVVRRHWVEVGFRVSNDFGGDHSNVVLSANREFGKWSTRLHLGYQTYDYGPTDVEDYSTRTGILAVSYKPCPLGKLTAQVESLYNRDLEQDVRLLVRIDRRFRLAP